MAVFILCMGYGSGMFFPRLHLPCVPLKVKAVGLQMATQVNCIA